MKSNVYTFKYNYLIIIELIKCLFVVAQVLHNKHKYNDRKIQVYYSTMQTTVIKYFPIAFVIKYHSISL